MSKSLTHLPIRADWLSTTHEDPIDRDIPIIDSHHHLYVRPDIRYLLEDYLTDIGDGHNVCATVYVQARAMLRKNADPAHQVLGETEFANGVAAMSASGLFGPTQVCAAIVGQADLTLGRNVAPILEQHIALAGGAPSRGGRFKGIRQSLTWDANSALTNAVYPTSQYLMESPEFRAGYSQLGHFGLHFEAWVFFHQLPQVAALARAFPDIPIVLNHCGGIVRIAQYESDIDAVFHQWRKGIIELSKYQNVSIKLSGLGMRLGGFEVERKPQAPNSQDLAQAWSPWLDICINAFGASRCMYGSNFPVDKGSYSYGIGINALKRVIAHASHDEKEHILWRTAKHFYQLSDDVMQASPTSPN